VDFARKIQYMTLDIIADIAFGSPFGFMDEDEDFWGYFKQAEAAVPMMQMIAMVPWLVALLQSPLFKPLMPSDKDPVGLGPVIR
jgi:hypothetical protein